jgi:hypothetical protein
LALTNSSLVQDRFSTTRPERVVVSPSKPKEVDEREFVPWTFRTIRTGYFFA